MSDARQLVLVACLAAFTVAEMPALSDEGLVAHFPMDEGVGSAVHDVAAGGSGTFAGVWAEGVQAGAVSFPFLGGGVAAAETQFRVAGALTLSAWVKVDNPAPTVATQMRIISKKRTWDAADGYDLEYDAFNRRFTLLGGGTNFARADGVRLAAGWHHVAATVSGTTARIYVNGVEVTTDISIGAVVAGSAPFHIGRHATYNAYFLGAIDEVRIYRRALNLSEITELATPPVTPAPSGLVGHWRFDENSGSVAADTSGHGHDGRLTPTSVVDGVTAQGPTWTSGVDGSAIAFHGVDRQRIDIGRRDGVSITDRLAISAWVRINDAEDTRDMRVLAKKTAWNSPYGYSLEYSPAKKLLTFLAGGQDYARTTGIHLTTGWHHLAASADGIAARLWVDGTEVTSDGTIGAIRANNVPLFLGLNSNGSAPMNGALDDVRLWAGTLGDAEVRLLASKWPNQGVAGPFAWIRKLRAPAANRPTTIARDGTAEALDASAAAPQFGQLTLTQWSGDNQAGGRGFAGNTLAGAPGENHFLGIRSFSLTEGSDASGAWTYAQKRQQDAQVRFGFIAASRSDLPFGHGLGPTIGSTLSCNAIVVCLPFRHNATGQAQWQVEYYAGTPRHRRALRRRLQGAQWQVEYYAGTPLQAGVWQVPAGMSLAQAQASPQNRLCRIKPLKKTKPGDATSLKLELTGAGHWRLLIDLDNDGVAEETEVSGTGDNRVSSLTDVTDDGGLLVHVEAASGSAVGKVGRTQLTLGYRESSGVAAPAGIAAR